MAQKKGIDDILKGGRKALNAALRKAANMADGPEKRMLQRDIRRAGEKAMRDPKAFKEAQAQFSRMGGRIGHLNEAATKSGKAGKAAKVAAASSIRKAEGLGRKIDSNPTDYALRKLNQGKMKAEKRAAGGVNSPDNIARREARRAAAKKAAAPKPKSGGSGKGPKPPKKTATGSAPKGPRKVVTKKILNKGLMFDEWGPNDLKRPPKATRDFIAGKTSKKKPNKK